MVQWSEFSLNETSLKNQNFDEILFSMISLTLSTAMWIKITEFNPLLLVQAIPGQQKHQPYIHYFSFN